jgi:hypothetical protein
MRTRRSPIVHVLARALTRLTAAAAIVAAGSVAACIVVEARPARSEVTTPPPAPQNEAAIACDAGYSRVPGYWRWNGYQYVSLPQRCVYRPGFRFEPGTYFACGDGWCFKEGAWIQLGR